MLVPVRIGPSGGRCSVKMFEFRSRSVASGRFRCAVNKDGRAEASAGDDGPANCGNSGGRFSCDTDNVPVRCRRFFMELGLRGGSFPVSMFTFKRKKGCGRGKALACTEISRISMGTKSRNLALSMSNPTLNFSLTGWGFGWGC